MPWLSKNSASGAAHYVLDDGTTACSRDTYGDGTPAVAPFLCTWEPFRESDHLCYRCRRHHPRVCLCGRCGIVPAKAKGAA